MTDERGTSAGYYYYYHFDVVVSIRHVFFQPSLIVCIVLFVYYVCLPVCTCSYRGPHGRLVLPNELMYIYQCSSLKKYNLNRTILKKTHFS